ncbi:hypothetical protein V8C44DRAFT_39199 [Trichoderma aethiopicum]
MASPRNQKRQRADEPSRADIDRPAKKGKTRSELDLDAWQSWRYPPQFYDRLSSISLTHRALQELNRRTASRPSRPSPPARPSASILSRAITRGLARFAESCPDLRDLRGYPHPPSVDPPQPVAMSASQSRSSNPASTRPTSATTKTKKSTPYDRNFELHLTENAIHPTWRSRKPDLEEIRAALAAPRSSLSPSRFSEAAFEAFQESDARAKDEEDVMANIIPTILGPSQASRFCARNTVFGNLDPLTDDSITAAKPDIYYGAYPEQLARPARNELSGHIVPSTMLDKPMAPNVFLEVKGPDGNAAVATRQARYDGAIGSRAMHSLQNYGAEQPQYDGKAYTFSFTYHAGTGTLQQYAHHVTAPTSETGRPEYHMTRLKAYAMTSDLETYVKGAAALRNTLDLAQQYRDTFIRTANARASQPRTAFGQEHAAEMRPPEDSADELAPSPACYTAQTQHEEDQRNEDSPDELALSPPRYLYAGDDSRDSPEVGASTSLTTSFTSSFGPTQSRSKRQRSPHSQAAESHASKTRSRSTRGARPLKPAAESAAAGVAESLQVQTYWRRGKLCFLNAQEHEVQTEKRDWVERMSDDGRQYFSWQSPKSGSVFRTAALAVKPRRKRANK